MEQVVKYQLCGTCCGEVDMEACLSRHRSCMGVIIWSDGIWQEGRQCGSRGLHLKLHRCRTVEAGLDGCSCVWCKVCRGTAGHLRHLVCLPVEGGRLGPEIVERRARFSIKIQD